MIIKLQRKVIYVKIPSEYIGSLALALLKALGDPSPSKGTVDDRLERAETQMASFKSELLILDSFDNLTRASDAKSAREADRTQARLRLILERGMPMLFVGVPIVRDSILNEEQLAHRIDEVNFDKLRDPDDAEEYLGYLTGLDLLMMHHEIFSKSSDLTEHFTPLFKACRGR
jgi:hypothetical protein